MSNQNKVSKCCKAPFHVEGSDEGTNCYICEKCGKGTDPFVPTEKGGEDNLEIVTALAQQGLKNLPPHSFSMEERFDSMFWLHRVPKNTKQSKDVKEFINQEVVAAILAERERNKKIVESRKWTMGIPQSAQQEADAINEILEDILQEIASLK